MKRIGTQIALSEEERGRLIDELRFWKNRSSEFYDTRRKEERAFLAVWKGQRPSGVREDTDTEQAWPFDGASDARVRWGDTVFQELLALITVALDSCRIEVVCDGSAAGVKRAAAIQKVIQWCRHKLGANWYAQIQALMRYMFVDTPAVGAMDIGWRVSRTRGVEIFDSEKMAAEYAVWYLNTQRVGGEDGGDGGEVPPEIEAQRDYQLALSGGDDAAAERLRFFLVAAKRVPEEHVDRLVAALIEDGEAECVVDAADWEGPEMTALRFGDDFIIPEATEDFDSASPMIRHQWIDEPQLRALAASDGWSHEWVEETLRHKGANFYDERDYSHVEDMKDMVDIGWFYTTETDEDGVTTRYVSVLSAADGSAFGKRVIRARRGKWETVFFRREVIAGNCLASRGLAHLCAPDQGLAKSMKDFANDNAIIGSLPPVKAQGSRVRNVVLEPFAVMNMGSSDNVSFMQPPAYPAAAREQVKEIKDEMLAFLGVSNGETDVSTRTRGFTVWMLSQFQELYKRLVEVVQDYASDEVLMTVTGETDTEGLRHEDLDGDFQLALRFDPANLDHESLIKRVNALGTVIAPLDVKNEIDRAPVLRSAFANLFPECAAESFKSPEQMAGEDVAEEQKNFVLIKAGVMPRMDTEGKWNYQARLDFYQQLQQENPDAIAEMSPRSQEMLQQWMAALSQQARQFGENAQIGRTGVPGVEGGAENV